MVMSSSTKLNCAVTYKLLIIYAALSSICVAQPPDTGQILRQQEQISPSINRIPSIEMQEPEMLSLPETEVSIYIKSIIINGGEALESQDILKSLVVDSVGQKLGFAQLQKLADKISQHLKAKGWVLAKAYLPKQDVTDGNVRINITLGHLEVDEQGHSISIQHDSDIRLKDEIIKDRMRYVISNNTLHSDKLERALLLLNDLPGIQSHSSLEKGKQTGSSRLGINVKEDDRIKGNFSIDDQGNHYTGTWVGNLNFNLNDPLGLGDQLSVGGMGAENIEQGRISYGLPLGDNGLQANVRYSYLSYNVGREFKQLESEGQAQSAGGGFSYPFIRSRAFSLWGSANYNYKLTDDVSMKVLTSQKEIDSGTMGFNGQHLDSFLGGGLNQFSYGFVLGNVDLSDAKADATTAKTQGIYDKHTFNLARLQKLTENFSLFASATGQLATQNLTSSEKFMLGGSTGVRAYPSGEGSGDSGWVSNFEMRYDVPYKTEIGSVQLVGFFDTGYIILHSQRWKNDVVSASGKNEYSLSGSGIGINFSHGNSFSIRGTWAHTIGDNKGLNVAGNDSSGQHDDSRFWLNTMLYF